MAYGKILVALNEDAAMFAVLALEETGATKSVFVTVEKDSAFAYVDATRDIVLVLTQHEFPGGYPGETFIHAARAVAAARLWEGRPMPKSILLTSSHSPEEIALLEGAASAPPDGVEKCWGRVHTFPISLANLAASIQEALAA